MCSLHRHVALACELLCSMNTVHRQDNFWRILLLDGSMGELEHIALDVHVRYVHCFLWRQRAVLTFSEKDLLCWLQRMTVAVVGALLKQHIM